MNLASTYDASEGKFPAAYGNVALIDCHYMLDYLFDYAVEDLKPEVPFLLRRRFQNFLDDLKTKASDADFTWCDFAYEIDGVLAN
jgi:hypothetical protein